MIFNFSGIKQRYDLHVDENCHYEEILNSDRDIYAGSNCLNNNLNSFNYTLPLNLAACSCTIIKKA